MSQFVNSYRRTDTALLTHLARERLAYPAVAAVENDIDVERARSRLEHLADEGLVEPVSPEVVYRITDRGTAFLSVPNKGSVGLPRHRSMLASEGRR